MRDLVIGVTVVLPDGTRASSGGKVVKNVAGYDLGKLFCGSRGRLGSVERLALKLHPAPVAARTVATAVDWQSLHRSQLVPSAVDIAGGRMHVLFEGSQRAVDAQMRALGGEESDPWDELRALQATLPGRVRWDGEAASLVRPGPRVAYVEHAREPIWSPLAERVREAMCSQS
jgi:FAD/FMN-containing dehydrogenase